MVLHKEGFIFAEIDFLVIEIYLAYKYDITKLVITPLLVKYRPTLKRRYFDVIYNLFHLDFAQSIKGSRQ